MFRSCVWHHRINKVIIMPELPEVQTVINDLNEIGLISTAIKRAHVYWERTIATPGCKEFRKRIERQRIMAISRRGKYIILQLSEDFLLIHLRMTGRLHIKTADEERLPHEHVVLDLDDDRQLRFHDTRKFGRWYLVRNPEDVLGKLGPEPLDASFTKTRFVDMLAKRRRAVKPLLLDQSFVVGLGNIYIDEALWHASIHPSRSASSLSNSEVEALHRAIQRVLREGLQNLGTTLGTGQTNFYSIAGRRGKNEAHLNVFRRTGMPCARCADSEIKRIVLSQRSTHYCPKCQI